MTTWGGLSSHGEESFFFKGGISQWKNLSPILPFKKVFLLGLKFLLRDASLFRISGLDTLTVDLEKVLIHETTKDTAIIDVDIFICMLSELLSTVLSVVNIFLHVTSRDMQHWMATSVVYVCLSIHFPYFWNNKTGTYKTHFNSLRLLLLLWLLFCIFKRGCKKEIMIDLSLSYALTHLKMTTDLILLLSVLSCSWSCDQSQQTRLALSIVQHMHFHGAASSGALKKKLGKVEWTRKKIIIWK